MIPALKTQHRPEFRKLIKAIALVLTDNNSRPSDIVVQDDRNRCVVYRQLQLIEQVRNGELYYVVNKDWKGTMASVSVIDGIGVLQLTTSEGTAFIRVSQVKALFEVAF